MCVCAACVRQDQLVVLKPRPLRGLTLRKYYIAYLGYPPLFFAGPILGFNAFVAQLREPVDPSTYNEGKPPDHSWHHRCNSFGHKCWDLGVCYCTSSNNLNMLQYALSPAIRKAGSLNADSRIIIVVVVVTVSDRNSSSSRRSRSICCSWNRSAVVEVVAVVGVVAVVIVVRSS